MSGAWSAEVNLPQSTPSQYLHSVVTVVNPVMASSALHVQVQSVLSFEALVALLALEGAVLTIGMRWDEAAYDISAQFRSFTCQCR